MGQLVLVVTFITLNIGHYWAVQYLLDSEHTFFWLVAKLTEYVMWFGIAALIIYGVVLAGRRGGELYQVAEERERKDDS